MNGEKRIKKAKDKLALEGYVNNGYFEFSESKQYLLEEEKLSLQKELDEVISKHVNGGYAVHLII